LFADLYGEQAIPPQTIESLDIPIGFSGGRILWSEGSEVRFSLLALRLPKQPIA
jgi:hypothetical protein